MDQLFTYRDILPSELSQIISQAVLEEKQWLTKNACKDLQWLGY